MQEQSPPHMRSVCLESMPDTLVAPGEGCPKLARVPFSLLSTTAHVSTACSAVSSEQPWGISGLNWGGVGQGGAGGPASAIIRSSLSYCDSYKALIPFMRAPPSGPHLTNPQSPHLLITSPWGLRLSLHT